MNARGFLLHEDRGCPLTFSSTTRPAESYVDHVLSMNTQARSSKHLHGFLQLDEVAGVLEAHRLAGSEAAVASCGRLGQQREVGGFTGRGGAILDMGTYISVCDTPL